MHGDAFLLPVVVYQVSCINQLLVFLARLTSPLTKTKGSLWYIKVKAAYMCTDGDILFLDIGRAKG